MKTIVASGINMKQGGIKEIYQLFIDEVNDAKLFLTYRFIFLVHQKDLFDFKDIKNHQIIEFKQAKSWGKRYNLEYKTLNKMFKDQDIWLWINLHDVTAKNNAKNQVTYFHNPTPLLKKSFKNLIYDYKVFIFSFLYKYLYLKNIKKAKYIIVQQQAFMNQIKTKIKKLRKSNFLVFPPVRKKELPLTNQGNPSIFFYPAFARPFKNFEVICKAAKNLVDKGITDFQVILTIDGSENRYAKKIVKKYQHIKQIKFIGLITRSEVSKIYQEVKTLIFPSKIETFGLPLSEAMAGGLNILAANLPYAKEVTANYQRVSFFDPLDDLRLSQLIEETINQTIKFIKNDYQAHVDINSYSELINLIEKDDNEK